jgi:hypothetical protein
MKKWFFEANNNVFRNRLDKSVITYEQYERLRGKYNEPAIDTILISLISKRYEKLESHTNSK